MKSRLLSIAVALIVAPSIALLAQRPSQIILGSILPANSVWDKGLKQMAAEWEKETDGRVTLRVRPGSVKNEGELLRLLRRTNRPNAGVFGLPGEIDDAFSVLNIPFFYASDDEVFHVIETLTPTFERVLADRGLVLLNWGHTGWAHLFSETRVESLEELKATKLYTTAGDEKMLRWYKENGFDPKPLAPTDVLLSLTTGLIDAHFSPPFVALLFQWYSKTPFMLDVPLAPVIGVTVVKERVWNQISTEDQQLLRASAKRLETQLMKDAPVLESDSIATMKERKLTVVELDDAATASLRETADTLTASWRGDMIPADVYDQALGARNTFRVDNVALSLTPERIEAAGDTVEVVALVEDAHGNPLSGVKVTFRHHVDDRPRGARTVITTDWAGEARMALVTDDETDDPHVTATAGVRRREDTVAIATGDGEGGVLTSVRRGGVGNPALR
jgi:TRAP-type C4-dicarboxylate transport system substrate-binding protein